MNIARKLSDWKIRNPGKIPNWPKQFLFQLLKATQSMRWDDFTLQLSSAAPSSEAFLCEGNSLL